MLNNSLLLQGITTFSIILIETYKLKCMKKKFFIFALMLMAVGMSFMVVSCSNDDDNVCIKDDACIEGEIVQVGEYGFIVRTDPISSGTYQCLGNTLIGISNSDAPKQYRFLGNRIAFKVLSYEYIGDRMHTMPNLYPDYDCRIELCN